VPPEGVVFAGKFIPGGATVTLQMYAVHTDPNLWEEPGKFKPEQWLKENSTEPLNVVVPLSRGMRVRIGRSLAETELRMVLSMLVYYFELLRVGNDEVMPITLVISRSRCGYLTVKVTERTTSSA
jgi:cytochrome P450